MKLLLDTSIFLYFINGDKGLSQLKHLAICSPENEVYLSAVSLWEIIVKHQLGKLPLPESPEVYIPRQRIRHGILPLNLDEASVQQLIKLPSIHRDPFDRMLICQALHHDMILVISDTIIPSYPISVL